MPKRASSGITKTSMQKRTRPAARRASRRARHLLPLLPMTATTSPQAASLSAKSCARASPRDRTLAIATVALLLSGVFDIGRALYCRHRLGYAVTQSASLLSRRMVTPASSDPYSLSTTAADLVRRMSGLTDLPRAGVRARRHIPVPPQDGGAEHTPHLTVTAHYTFPLLSPHVRIVFRNGRMTIHAVAVQALPRSFPGANALRSAA
jgi:hypothetical protein